MPKPLVSQSTRFHEKIIVRTLHFFLLLMMGYSSLLIAASRTQPVGVGCGSLFDPEMIHSAVEINGYRVEVFKIHLGRQFDEGGDKLAFEVKDLLDPLTDKPIECIDCVALMSRESSNELTQHEIQMLLDLKVMEFPTAEIIGVAYVSGRLVIIEKKYIGSSKILIHPHRADPPDPDLTARLNAQSKYTLEQIKSKLLSSNIWITDFQMLLAEDGSWVINDPRMVLRNVPETQLREYIAEIIDPLLGLIDSQIELQKAKRAKPTSQ